MTNPYNEPEALGLTKIGEADLMEPDYSFDIIAAWRGPLGVYLGTDSGCSCPSPFESFDGMDDLTGPLTTDQALEEASSLKGTDTYDLTEFNHFLGQIRASEK